MAATQLAAGTVPVAGLALILERLDADLNNETWEEAQEPEMVLDKKTEHMAVGR